MEMFENKNTRSLEKVVKEFIIPNCWLQIQPEIVNRGGMAIPYILSKPGAGKTTIIKQLCNQNKFGLFVLHPALKPIEEWGGLPNFKNVMINDYEFPGTEWTISEVIIELMKIAENHKLVIMLWDDMHLCGQHHLSLMQEAFSERSIRGFKLPDNVALLLAGNDNNKAGYKSLSSAISNRCARCYVHTDYEDWKNNFAIKNNIHPSIITFLGNNLYQKFFHEDEVVDEPWSSPRSWTRFSNYIQSMESWNNNQPLDPQIVNFYCSAHVGSDAGSEFSKYYNIYMKFNVKQILDDCQNFKLSEDSIDDYPLAFAILYHYGSLSNKDQIELIPNITKIINVFFENSKALSLLIFRELIHIEKIHKKNIVLKIIQEAEKNYNNMVETLIKSVDNVNDK